MRPTVRDRGHTNRSCEGLRLPWGLTFRGGNGYGPRRPNDGLLSILRDAFRATFDTNVLGAIEVCRVFVPPMAERGYGRVVNVSSGVGQFARMSTYAPAYSISKTALNAFTRVLAAIPW